jgi:hypothetical protein
MPLGEIFDLIEKEYGVKIAGRDGVDLSRRYNFMPDDGVSIEQVMQALQFAGGEFDYRVDGDTVTLDDPAR